MDRATNYHEQTLDTNIKKMKLMQLCDENDTLESIKQIKF